MPADHKVLASLLIILCMSAEANAQDMFVRPTNQAAHPVDLGIVVKPAAPTQPTAQPSPNVATPPSQQIKAPPVPQQQIPTQTVQPTRPVPQPAQPVAQIPSLPVPAPDGTVEVIKVNETPVSIPPGSGANTFSVAIQPAAVGQKEVNQLYKQLGLSPQEIVANCAYENSVVLAMGERNGAILAMGKTAVAQQKFNSALTSVDILPTLACKKIRPPISGTIIEQGGYYKISATDISCPPPRSGSLALTFRYLGNGKGECLYK